MSISPASQPAIVLSHQKDAHHRQELRTSFTDAAEKLLGPHVSIRLLPEMKMLAESFYFWLTLSSASGQTLGEEYCDVIQVGATRLPSMKSRLLLFAFGIIGPYVHKRIVSGGWEPLMSVFKPAQTAAERAAEIRTRMILRQQETNDPGKGKMLKSMVKTLLSWASIVARMHLALFYLRGDFYDISKRIAGIKSVFTKEITGPQPSYAILGWFLAFQIGIEGFNKLRHAVRKLHWGFPLPDEAEMIVPSESCEKEDASIMCGICLCPASSPSCPPCGHMFCYQHIVEAVVVKNECPLCRQAALPNTVIRVYSTL